MFWKGYLDGLPCNENTAEARRLKEGWLYEIQIFKNDLFEEIRVMIIDDEEWFVLVDICDALGIKNATDVSKRLDEDEVTKEVLPMIRRIGAYISDNV